PLHISVLLYRIIRIQLGERTERREEGFKLLVVAPFSNSQYRSVVQQYTQGRLSPRVAIEAEAADLPPRDPTLHPCSSEHSVKQCASTPLQATVLHRDFELSEQKEKAHCHEHPPNSKDERGQSLRIRIVTKQTDERHSAGNGHDQ